MSMSVLPDAITPPAPELAIALRLQKQNDSVLVQLIADFQLVFTRLWHDPNTAPQAIFDEFDVDGEARLSTIQARLDCIEAIAIANGQTLADYVDTVTAFATPAYTTSGGVVTVT